MQTEEDYYIEFKKAYYKFAFDKIFFSDIYEIENAHYCSIGAILWMSRENSEGFYENPLEKRQPIYGI